VAALSALNLHSVLDCLQRLERSGRYRPIAAVLECSLTGVADSYRMLQ
jgi:hypothetical protein